MTTQVLEMRCSTQIIKAYFDRPKRIEQHRRCAATADPLAPEINRASRDEELNLLYMSVTQAMQTLAVNSLIIDIMQRYKKLHGSIALHKTSP